FPNEYHTHQRLHLNHVKSALLLLQFDRFLTQLLSFHMAFFRHIGMLVVLLLLQQFHDFGKKYTDHLQTFLPKQSLRSEERRVGKESRSGWRRGSEQKRAK